MPALSHAPPPLQLYDLYAREYVGLPVDIWALGVLLYLLCFGRLPFEGEAKLQVRLELPAGWLAAGLAGRLLLASRLLQDVHNG